MKTLIICKSIHKGNTEKIAKKLSEILDANLIKPEEFDSKNIKEYDLIGLADKIYNSKVFIFSTSGLINKTQHDTLKQILKKNNVKLVDEFFCKGFDKNNDRTDATLFESIMIMGLQLIGGINKGRPNEFDFERAKDFAKKLKNK